MNNLKQSIREIAMADNSIVSSPQMGTVKQQIAECAVRILSKESPLHRKEIFRRMTEEEGVIVGGKYPLDKMSAYLSQDARFTPAERGEWQLVARDETQDDHGDREAEESMRRLKLVT